MTTSRNPSAPREPRVSVIVPVYNGVATLPAALDSALAQRFRSFEIVVVNDGSTDGSGELAHAYARRVGRRIRVIDQPNAGLPAARNTAICAARGAYFALLDADDVWLPQHLQRAMQVFDADPDLGLVHANIRCIDASGHPLGVPRRHWRRDLDAFREIALRREHVSCPTAVFPRTAVQVVGGFDLQFTGLGCEDRDLWLRIAERFRIHYIDEVTACYRIAAGSMSRNRPKMAAARQRLLAKLSLSPRGAPLCRELEAMIESDLGLELLAEGQRLPALAAQVRALRGQPANRTLWRRLLRTAAVAAATAMIPGRMQPA